MLVCLFGCLFVCLVGWLASLRVCYHFFRCRYWICIDLCLCVMNALYVWCLVSDDDLDDEALIDLAVFDVQRYVQQTNKHSYRHTNRQLSTLSHFCVATLIDWIATKKDKKRNTTMLSFSHTRHEALHNEIRRCKYCENASPLRAQQELRLLRTRSQWTSTLR